MIRVRHVLLACAVALGVLSGCSRTGLPLDACFDPGATRACTTDCGPGVQRCAGARWGECVSPATVPCSNACGDGIARCQEGGLSACDVPVATRACSTICGDGTEECRNGAWGSCSAPSPRPATLHCIVRDFSSSHPDFELPITGDNSDRGLVAVDLGADGTPVYQGGAGTLTTSGAATFFQWYHDVPGVNERTEIDLPLTAAAGGYFEYANTEFFPIDGRLLGNEGRPHNYHFTLQAHSAFDYAPGDHFSFTGDDDVWVFLNRRLAIDLGGVHESQSADVDLDAAAAKLGITPGNRYDFDLFFAERHTDSSDFTLRSTLALHSSCP